MQGIKSVYAPKNYLDRRAREASKRNVKQIMEANAADASIVVDSKRFSNLPASSRDRVLRLRSAANHRRILGANKKKVGQRGSSRSKLGTVPQMVRNRRREAHWMGQRRSETHRKGPSHATIEPSPTTTRQELMQSVRNRWWRQLCASAMWVMAFRTNDGTSPFHLGVRTAFSNDGLTIEVEDLPRAFETADPPVERQPAVTARSLRDLLKMAKGQGKTTVHTANLTAGAFFFAMRGGDFSNAERPGKTTPIEVRDVTFWDNKKRQLDRSISGWEDRAMYVRITFRQQRTEPKRKHGHNQDQATSRSVQSGCGSRSSKR